MSLKYYPVNVNKFWEAESELEFSNLHNLESISELLKKIPDTEKLNEFLTTT